MPDFFRQTIKIGTTEIPLWIPLAAIGGIIGLALLIFTGDPGSGPHPGDGAGAINEP